MSQGIVCPACQATNRSNARFCAHCGAALTGAAAAPAPQCLQPGALVRNGAYRIQRLLSKGGMGMIYLAKDRGAFDRLCVVKEMLDYFDPANPQEVQEARRRFEDEARTLAKLKHPQIPDLLSYFSEGQHNYIVMQYIEGETLEHFIGQHVNLEEVVDYGTQMCETLEYLAMLTPPVVHQDIKPANIIVNRGTKFAWLVDFGVAKARLAKQQNGQVGVKKSSIFGTTGYAPPEQYQGQSEPKSDVYALAATLYHVLTGDDPQTHPFTFPQVATLPAGVAGALSAALEQNVQRRCTASDFRQALENALRASAPKKATVPLPAASQHESYAVIVTQPIADADRPGMIRFLQQELGISALEAEVLTWQSPARILRGIDKTQAQAMGQKLKARGAVGVSYVTSQLYSWRQRLSPSEQSKLVHQGEVFIYDKRLPQDRLCECHHCHHSWKTQARDQSTLPKACPHCHRDYWYLHRIFRCALCGHEFTNRDQTTPAERLCAACPKCTSTAWLPKQQICFMQNGYAVKLPPTPLGGRLVQKIQLEASPRGALIRGRVATKTKWLVSPTLQDDLLSFVVDTHALTTARRSHTASLEVISNAGVATVTVEVYVEAPPLLAVTPSTLDFGVVRANETRTLKLEMRNMGEQVLTGQLTCADGWLTVDKSTFVANQYVVRCTVLGDRLPNPGANTTTLTITSNGSVLNLPVRAEALPTTLAVTPHTLDFHVARRRSTAPQPLVIENVGVGRLTGALHSDAPWLLIRDVAVQSNHLETLVEVDAADLEPGQSVTSALRIVTNGGAIDVPVTVQVAARGPLERLAKLILLSVIIAVAGVGVLWWVLVQSVVTPPSIDIVDAPPTLTATPTPHAATVTLEPVIVQPPVPATPTPGPSTTSSPSATLTPTPATTDSLQVIDRLRTLLAQRATQTVVAGAPVASTARAALPTVAPPSAQCNDLRAVITAPLPGQTLRGNAPVYGTAEHAAFRYYKVEIAPQQEGEEQFSFIANNNAPVTAGLLAVIDTTRFNNGAYVLQLTVVDLSGNFPAPCQVAVTIEN